MNIENYYTVLAMVWIGWLLVLIVQCVWFEALHDKVMVKSRGDWDRYMEDKWVLRDRKGENFKLVSEGALGDREITLILIYPFLLPVFGTYCVFSNKSLNVLVGILLSVSLFTSVPYIYNSLSTLSFNLDTNGLFIGFN